MKETISEIGRLCVALVVMGLIFVTNDHRKRLEHLESVTFESSRCPDNKSFSLINLRS